MNEYNISVYQGYDSDKYLDNLIKDLKSDYLVLSPYGNKNDKLLSEGDFMISLLEEFIKKAKNADDGVPVFIFGVFDRIDENVDIKPYINKLLNSKKTVYISVLPNYNTDCFIELNMPIFKV